MSKLLVVILLILKLFARQVTFAEYKIADAQIDFIESKDFNTAIEKGNWFIFFGASWCGHCQAATPEWLDLQTIYGNSFKEHGVLIKKVECTRNQDLCESQNLDGFPSFNNGKKITEFEVGSGIEKTPTLDTLYKFCLQTLRGLNPGQHFEISKSVKKNDVNLEKIYDELKEMSIRDSKPKNNVNPDGRVVYLTDASFDKLSPVMDSLAPETKNYVNIAKVDCTVEKATCNRFDIRGFPTLKFFQDGEFTSNYNGARTLEELKKFSLGFLKDPAFTPLKSKDVVNVLNENEVSFFFIYTPDDDGKHKDQLETIYKAAKKIGQKHKVFVSPDANIIKLLNINLEQNKNSALVVLKENGKSKFQFESDVSSSNLSKVLEWMNRYKNPLIPVMDSENSEALLGGDHILLLSILDFTNKNENIQKELKTFLKSIDTSLAKNPKLIKFAMLNGKQFEKYVRNTFKFELNDLPKFVILDNSNEKYYDVDKNNKHFEYKVNDLMQALNDFNEGNLV
ncbi:Thioredoxin domain-containing protein 5, partial [Lobulomyces angularis]